MKQVYIKENGKKIFVSVTDETESALTETRRAIWRNDAQEKYHRATSLDAMTDKDGRTGCTAANPETTYIAAEEIRERTAKLAAALKTLTPGQAELVKLLEKGLGVREIARLLNKDHQSVRDMRERIREKIKKYYDYQNKS
jgi:DNA-binding NarL/FixJ family response regulator